MGDEQIRLEQQLNRCLTNASLAGSVGCREWLEAAGKALELSERLRAGSPVLSTDEWRAVYEALVDYAVREPIGGNDERMKAIRKRIFEGIGEGEAQRKEQA